MKKKHILSCTLFLAFCLMACEGPSSGSKAQIQFEITENNFSEDQRVKTKHVIQKRLESLGASNIEITEDQKNIVANYTKGADSVLTWQSFQTIGKLEFFEVCNKKEILYKYLDKTYASKLKSDEKITILKDDEIELNLEEAVNFLGIIELNFNFNEDPIFGYVAEKHKARAEELLIQKEPVFISALKRRVKFLLGKPDANYKQGKYPLHAVYVTSTNEAPLDGSYVTEAGVSDGHIENRYVINLQMNKEGAIIWERLTEKTYQERGNIAIVIDDVVYSAPSVNTGKIVGGNTQVSGNFTRGEATILASIIRSGVLPNVKIVKMQTVKE
ncbi:hypothetical protein H2O64_15530 [Kordia sp. YSTF-M3]|uniref:SecDF P1 head subdomain domain-containing protein n=1 Tax=Kordia aestuariivivens TaxID=2759037 RepID=A0ABR7QC80_9FLAO|nr:hypothetical protein [Kordia aestuariivivens]MBC8756088.1 hypothetical protein [Kordia aestuariivivens]